MYLGEATAIARPPGLTCDGYTNQAMRDACWNGTGMFAMSKGTRTNCAVAYASNPNQRRWCEFRKAQPRGTTPPPNPTTTPPANSTTCGPGLVLVAGRCEKAPQAETEEQARTRMLLAWASETTPSVNDPYMIVGPAGVLRLTHRPGYQNVQGYVYIPIGTPVDAIPAIIAARGAGAITPPAGGPTWPLPPPPGLPATEDDEDDMPGTTTTPPATPPAVPAATETLFSTEQIKTFLASPTGKVVAYAAAGFVLLKLLKN